MEPLQGFANLGASEISRLTHSALSSARRWITERKAPWVVVAWLRLTAWGELEAISERWTGWTLRNDGKLHSPEGAAFTPAEVITIPLRLQQIASLELAAKQRAAEPRRDEARGTDADQKPDPQRSKPRRRGRHGFNGVAHCSLSRRHIVNSAYPSAETSSPIMTPSAMRAVESFTGVA
jgi:hypothetical protein